MRWRSTVTRDLQELIKQAEAQLSQYAAQPNYGITVLKVRPPPLHPKKYRSHIYYYYAVELCTDVPC